MAGRFSAGPVFFCLDTERVKLDWMKACLPFVGCTIFNNEEIQSNGLYASFVRIFTLHAQR
jgi:hypothetical protein